MRRIFSSDKHNAIFNLYNYIDGWNRIALLGIQVFSVRFFVACGNLTRLIRLW